MGCAKKRMKGCKLCEWQLCNLYNNEGSLFDYQYRSTETEGVEYVSILIGILKIVFNISFDGIEVYYQRQCDTKIIL